MPLDLKSSYVYFRFTGLMCKNYYNNCVVAALTIITLLTSVAWLVIAHGVRSADRRILQERGIYINYESNTSLDVLDKTNCTARVSGLDFSISG